MQSASPSPPCHVLPPSTPAAPASSVPARRSSRAGRATLFLSALAIAAGCGGLQGGGAAPVGAPPAKPAPPQGAARSVASALPVGWRHAAVEGVTSARGMVVSDAALASDVGRDVLAQGGNAVDAAVALAFALAVVYPAAGNVGGGGFLTARVGGVPHALDFRETAPARASRDMYVDAAGKPTGASQSGHLAAGVPGSVAGLHAAWSKLGSKKKTWAELVAPAIKLAEEGFPVDATFADMLGDRTRERLKKNAASAALFFPGGAAPAVGTRFRNPDLGKVLRRVAERGPDGFYKGETAELLAADMAKHGGILTKEDLAGYTAKWRTPLEFTYRGQRITSMPPPSSGGVVLGMICKTLEGWDLGALPWRAPEEVHLEVEAMRRAFAARNARLGDPDFVRDPSAELLSDANVAALRRSIDPKRATPSSAVPAGGASPEGPNTTHLAVVDAAGNAVALTTTINWWFGGGVTVEGTGIVLNNEMDDFAAKPGTANGFGLVQGEPNAVAPGKRMLSSMTPTIVTDAKGEVVLVLGAAGGPTIITAVFEILSNVVDHRMDAATATAAPRFHHQHVPDRVVVEQGGFPDELKAALGAMGHAFEEREHIADAPSIGRAGAALLGAREPRRPSARAAGW